jgi:PAS domain S-box-containing protein
LMDEIRPQVDLMVAEEDRLLVVREKVFNSQVRFQNNLMTGLVAVDIALILGATILILRLNQSRREADALTDEANVLTDQANIRTQKAKAQNEQALRASELSYRRLFEAAKDGILILDVDTGRINDVNPFLFNLLGFSRDEMMGKTVGELSPFKDIEENKVMLSRLQKDGYVRYEDLPMETRDGRHVSVEFVSNVYKAGDENVIQCNVRDITQRKRTEAALVRLASIVESSDDAIIGKNLDSIITSWNRGAEKIFGYTADEIVGTSIMRLIPIDRQDEENFILEKIKRGESVEHFETLRKTRDGRQFDAAITASPIKDANGKVTGVSKVVRNISDRKQVEKALRETRTRLNSTLAAGSIGTWNWDIVNDRLTADEFTARMFSIETDAAAKGLPAESYLQAVFEKDRAGVTDGLDRAMKSCGKYDLEYRVRQKNGELFWLQARGRVDCDSAGKPLSFHGAVMDITERKRAEGRFRRLVDSDVQGVMFWNTKGEITGANDAFLRIVGYTRKELEAGNVRWSAMTPPEYADVDRHSLAEVTAKGVNTPYEKEFFRKDGSRVPILMGAAIFEDSPDEGVCFVLDITERKRAEEKMSWLASFPQRNPNPIVELDLATDVVHYVNPCTIQVFPNLQNEGMSHPLLAGLQEIQNTLLDGKTETARRDVSAGELFFSQTITYIPEAKRLRVYSTDITERKAAEQKVHQLNSELEERVIKRTGELEAANKELEAFSYSISHDLRAPLRAVNGFAGIVLEDFGPQLPEEGRGYLERIRAGAVRMGVLIDDLLAFSRLSRQSVNRQAVNSTRIVNEVLDELKPQREGRQIEIKIGELPECHGDAGLLQQIWANLISNAIKYTRGREPAIIEIGCAQENGEDVFFVRDNGAGFDMQYANKLFGVFQRLHRDDQFEGTGVGLAIVQRIVHRHGGRVWAQAEENRGATFYFTIGETKL